MTTRTLAEAAEAVPQHLDADGKLIWEQCDWIINGGSVTSSVPLILQALYIRRELRLESENIQLRRLLSRLAKATENTLNTHQETRCCTVTRAAVNDAKDLIAALREAGKMGEENAK